MAASVPHFNHTHLGTLHAAELTDLAFGAVGLILRTTRLRVGACKLQAVKLIAACLTG